MHGTSAGAKMTGATGPRPTPTPWTPAQDALLRELWSANVTCTQIGVRLGKTKSSVTGRVHRQKLPPRPSPIINNSSRDYKFEAQQRDAILAMHRDGIVDANAISKNTGIYRKRVVAILNRAGIKLGRVGPAPKKKSKISARLTQWTAAGPSTSPLAIFNHDVDPATLVAGVGASRRHCQFIPGDPKGERTLYCGRPTMRGLAYCEHHVHICYRPHPLQAARQGVAE